MKLLLTCEHAGNSIPEEFRELFSEADDILKSHRGYDPGAFDLFTALKDISWFNSFHLESRLLVEVNRSVGHPQLFSEFTKGLSVREKEKILREYYFPYRNQIESKVLEAIEAGEEVLHLSVHTFTPVLKGEERKADIGLLFDPARKQEKDYCISLRRSLRELIPYQKTFFNSPYLGKADGLTTYLRKRFPESYSGIEIEVNQKFLTNNRMASVVKEALIQAIPDLVIRNSGGAGKEKSKE